MMMIWPSSNAFSILGCSHSALLSDHITSSPSAPKIMPAVSRPILCGTRCAVLPTKSSLLAAFSFPSITQSWTTGHQPFFRLASTRSSTGCTTLYRVRTSLLYFFCFPLFLWASLCRYRESRALSVTLCSCMSVGECSVL